ncbi:hypothetical protein AAF712_009423 [Marasmius tenuissimus]|uniref:DUF6535 domain-containing protein n=1 Tax=Marasmius tenuissimus TaxID=585030 RepID=A0ABR2ZQN5_9AGAR
MSSHPTRKSTEILDPALVGNQPTSALTSDTPKPQPDPVSTSGPAVSNEEASDSESKDMSKGTAELICDKPTVEKSWEVLTKEVNSLDEGLVGGWKEDIDTLLVFAGLFSAVVTAFTIESYQWLQEAPEDTTVTLLRQISRQLNDTTTPTSREVFEVSPIVVRINILWFLSLIIALVDALFALLCKQWLREHRRFTHTRTPAELLTLSWLRNQSLQAWHIHTILASLPMLLELAVFLFLAGVLELLRDRHRVVFAIALGVVGFAGLFYLGTTVIPTVSIARQALQVTPQLREMRLGGYTDHSPIDFIMSLPPLEHTCPFKSPQAWATFQAFKFVSRVPGLIRRSYVLCYRDYSPSTEWAFVGTINSFSNWSSVDLEIIQRSNVKLAPPLYELNAFRWLVSELRDSPIMIPHLHNTLKTLPTHLVMPAVLDQWCFLPHREWTTLDIEAVLQSHSKDGSNRYRRRSFLGPQRETVVFNRLLHYINVLHGAADLELWDHERLPELLQELQSGNESIASEFHDIGLPIHIIDKLPQFSNLDFDEVWRNFAGIFESPFTGDQYRATVMKYLAAYIVASSPDYTLHAPRIATTSRFIRSNAGRGLLSKMHNIMLERFIYRYTQHEDNRNWMEAMDIVRRIHRLPRDYFTPIPGYFPVSLSRLQKSLNNLSRTEPSIDHFEYLGSFRKYWDNAVRYYRWELLVVLSDHINDFPRSNAEWPTRRTESKVSPLVASPAGLEFIAFVNDQLVVNRDMYDFLIGETRIAWQKVIEQARGAHSELPPDYFRSIAHETSDSDYEANLSRREARAGTHDGESSGPRIKIDTEKATREEDATACSEPQPSPESQDDTGLSLVGDPDPNQEESIPLQLVVARNPGRRNLVRDEEAMGGPGADGNM